MTRAAALLSVALLAACAVTGDGAGTAPPAWEYDVTVAPALDRLDVRMRLADGADSLALGDDAGLAALTGPALPRDGRTFSAAGVPAGAEIAYSVDLAALTSLGSGRRRGGDARRVGRDLRLSAGLWLLRPAPAPRGESASLRFHLPPDVHASVPWAPEGDGWRLDPTTFRIRGFVAFTHAPPRRVDVGGAAITVSLLDGARGITADDAERAIAGAASAVAALYRGFPVPRAQVLLEPVPGRAAVPFGMALRGGGRSVHLTVGADAAPAALLDDWTPVHELTHLGMPWLGEEDVWMTEGWVTYYTELLLGRGGRRGERETWQAIVEGFERGRRDTGARSLVEHSREMPRTHAFMPVYWGGAATALALDVELRRSTDGRLSLDDAVRELRRLHVDARGDGMTDETTAQTCLEELDRWLGRPLFTQTCARMLARPAIDGTDALLGQLGVRAAGGRLELDDAAPLAELRRAIAR